MLHFAPKLFSRYQANLKICFQQLELALQSKKVLAAKSLMMELRSASHFVNYFSKLYTTLASEEARFA